MLWRLKACAHCLGGDLFSYDSEWWACFQCGAEAEATNGAHPSRHKHHRKRPSAEEMLLTERLERFLAMLGPQDGGEDEDAQLLPPVLERFLSAVAAGDADAD